LPHAVVGKVITDDGDWGPLATKSQFGKVRALQLASVICEVHADGFTTWRAMTDELNRRGIPTPKGCRWHRTSVGRVLARLGMTSSSTRGGNGAVANKRAADMRAKALAAVIHSLRAAGFASCRALAHELNVRKIPSAQGGRWHRTTVARVLNRLAGLRILVKDQSCASQHRRRRNRVGAFRASLSP